jgi:hypothetical protein
VVDEEKQVAFIALYEQLMNDLTADETVCFADAPFVEPPTVDGNSAVQIPSMIEARNPIKSAIHLIRDNAPYHRCEEARRWLPHPECRIRLIQLPASSPHLNPIERLRGRHP